MKYEVWITWITKYKKHSYQFLHHILYADFTQERVSSRSAKKPTGLNLKLDSMFMETKQQTKWSHLHTWRMEGTTSFIIDNLHGNELIG